MSISTENILEDLISAYLAMTYSVDKDSKEFKELGAGQWLQRKEAEIKAASDDYDVNMKEYNRLMDEVAELREQAQKEDGYRKKDLLQKADELEREAQSHYRSYLSIIGF